jgi:N6-L-threonylcarbamoyladenine synthase
MLILGLESSCDETAAAVTCGGRVLAERIRSQIDLHKIYGGVVPEIASRAHLEAVDTLTREVLADAGLKLSDLDGLAVTQGPGLVGALLVAVSFAKGLSMDQNLPLAGVNHVQAHALSAFLHEDGPPEIPQFPLAALVASGGHTSLFEVNDYLSLTLLGQTLDDASGEAFDKLAKLAGWGYPGGRIVEETAVGGDPQVFPLTRPLLHKGLDFSFSGLKTQVLTLYQKNKLDQMPAGHQSLKDLAASFQEAVTDVLVHKLVRAVTLTQARSAVIAGGVACNGRLRQKAARALEKTGCPLFIPPPKWCADNGAMIAFLGGKLLEAGQGILPLNGEARPRWSVG